MNRELGNLFESIGERIVYGCSYLVLLSVLIYAQFMGRTVLYGDNTSNGTDVIVRVYSGVYRVFIEGYTPIDYEHKIRDCSRILKLALDRPSCVRVVYFT